MKRIIGDAFIMEVAVKLLVAILLFPFFILANQRDDYRVEFQHGTICRVDSNSSLAYTYTEGPLPIQREGIYRYRASFKNPSNITAPALYFGAMYYPCRVYVNNTELHRWGELKSGKGMTNYSAKTITIPLSILKEDNEITIDFWTDGTTMELAKHWIDESVHVTRKVEIHNALNKTGIKISVIFSFIVFIISLTAYFLYNRPSKALLYFSLFALSNSLGFHPFLFNSVAIDHIFQTQLFRSATLMMALTLFLHISEMTKYFRNRSIHLALFLVLLPIIVQIWGSSSKFEVEQIISKAIPFYLAPLMIISSLLILVSLIKKKSPSLWLLLGNFLIIFVSTYNDLTSVLVKSLPDIWLLPYSFMGITITISAILIHIQLKMYKENEANRTELVRLNSTLEITNRELEEAKKVVETENATRESFIKTVAHELRTPLTGLLGGVDIIASDEKLPPHLEKPFFFIKSSFHRLFVTVSNLFDFVEMKRGAIPIVSHPFNVKTTLEPVLSLYRHDARVRGISLITLPSKTLPMELYGDSTHLLQIIHNLISNAIKFTDEGGVSCSIDYKDNALTLEIKDTGKGIGESEQQAMFNAFSRGEDFSFSQKYEGIGLGLAIVDATVKAMKGTITFSSEAQKGTTFSVSLPMLTTHQKQNEFRSPKRVLVVEDNPVNSLMLCKQLEKRDFLYDTAENGEEAINQCHNKRFDIILMDIQMPIMDGLTATKHIRTFNANVPIIAVTANADPQECLHAGMNAILMKPVPQDKLISVITEHIINNPVV